MLPSEEKGEGRPMEVLLARLERNPKRTFLFMVGILGGSIVGNVLYAVLKEPEKRPEMNVSAAPFTLDPLSQGIGGIVRAGSSMTEAMQIKEDINELLGKETLTEQDSVKLLVAFERLEQINRSLLPHHKDKNENKP